MVEDILQEEVQTTELTQRQKLIRKIAIFAMVRANAAHAMVSTDI